jgi:hypothetical protein
VEKAFIEPTGTLLIVALLFFPIQGKGLPLLEAHERVTTGNICRNQPKIG